MGSSMCITSVEQQRSCTFESIESSFIRDGNYSVTRSFVRDIDLFQSNSMVVPGECQKGS
jgi:hypothetical protein